MYRGFYRRVFCLAMIICTLTMISPDPFDAGFFAPVQARVRTSEPDGPAGKGKSAEVWELDGKTVRVTKDPSDVALATDRALPYHTGSVSIDMETGQVETEEGDSTAMEKVFPISRRERRKLFAAGRRKNKKRVEEFLEGEGVYSIDNAGEDAVTVSFPYAYKRLMVFAGFGSLKNSFGASKISYFAPAGHYILEYPTEDAARDAHLLLKEELGGESVIPDLPVHSCSSPFSSFTETEARSVSWGTDMMHLDEVRDRINEDADMTDTITVAVIDSGINTGHELFAGRLAEGAKSLIEDTTSKGDGNPVEDDYGHGSHVAGILADATPNQVKILPVKALDKNGNGSFSVIIDSLAYVIEKADVINLSLGADMSDMAPGSYNYQVYQKLEELFKSAKGKKCICVTSAGNVSGSESRDIAQNGSYPAFSDYVLAVTSMDQNKMISSRSYYGDCVDFTAPGISINSAAKAKKEESDPDYVKKSGTSMAAAHVSAACAVAKLYNRDAPNNTIVEYLAGLAEDLGVSGKDKYYGYGLITFQNGTVEKLEYDETSFEDYDEDDPGSGNKNGNSGNSNDGSGSNNGNSGNSGHNNGSSGNNNAGNDSSQNTSHGSGEGESAAGLKKGSSVKVAGATYKVTKMATGSAPGTLALTTAKNTKNVTIPATVTLDDKKKYKVTTVGAKAFTAGRIRTVTIGSKVSKITARAFYKSKAGTVILKTKALKKSTVKDSLTGSKVKTVKIKLGSNKLNKKYRNIYKKIFKKKNVGKKVNIK